MDTLNIIKTHSLTVRKIPEVVVTKWRRPDSVSIKDGEEVEIFFADLAYFKGNQKALDRFNASYPNGRLLIVETRHPLNAGRWLVQHCSHTSSNVVWSYKNDCVGDTLEEAVAAWVNKNVN